MHSASALSIHVRHVCIFLLRCACVFALITPSHAQVPIDAQRDIEEQRRIQERADQLRQQQERTPDVRSPNAPAPGPAHLPAQETPCFPIQKIALRGDVGQRFAWVLDALDGPGADDTPLGQCIGAQGVGILQQRGQAALIARGYVSTRLLVAPQDLNTGTLALTLITGRLHAV